jgi:hypothetical protein
MLNAAHLRRSSINRFVGLLSAQQTMTSQKLGCGDDSYFRFVLCLCCLSQLYTSVGDVTCHGGWSPGSYDHWQTDADTFAGWEVDYVKIEYVT